MTDGGSGGALTNIPGANGPTLSINTSALGGLNVSYALMVGNGAGSTTSETTVLPINAASAPIVSEDTSPASPYTMFVGGAVKFTASFVGTLPISYQWLVDKGTGPTNIVGQTNETLWLASVSLADSGNYSLTANNSAGSSPSSGAQLTVVPVPTAPFTVNFQWHSTEDGNDVGDYSGAGIPGYGAGTFWNQVIGPVTNTVGTQQTWGVSNALADDGSTQTGFQWSVTDDGSWDWTSAPIIPLLDSGADAYYPTPQSFQFTLPSGIYNVIIFTCDGTQSTNRDSINVVTLNGITKTAAPTNDNAFVEGGTYLVFPDIAVTGTTLTGTWAAGNATQNLADINGAQLQYIGPIVSIDAIPVGNGQVRLQWSQGTLLQASEVTGPWTTNSATSPYTVTESNPQMFYKVVIP
jgi:hypothetical protein